MRIKTIMCNADQAFYDNNAEVRRALSTDKMELIVTNIAHGPDSLESAYDAAIAAPYIIEQVMLAQEEGCDAVVIDCAADPVLRAAREICDIPVVSAGEASHHIAMQVAPRFSVITVLKTSAHEIEENIIRGGYSSRLASIRSAEVSVLGLADRDHANHRVLETAKKAVNEDGAHAIVLGCTGMIALQRKLQKQLGVPVVEPYTAGIETAATLVRMNLVQSRAGYIKAGDKSFY